MLTPLDIHNKEFKRAMRGYEMNDVDDFLDEVIKDYEQIYKENLNLKEQIEEFKDDIARYRDLEDTLHNTLILAQQTAEDVRQNAEKEAELIIANARHKGEAIITEYKEKVIELQNEYRDLQKKFYQFKAQYKSFLMAQLELIEENNNQSFDRELEQKVVGNKGE